eukprot:scaffold163976_cov37-Prasinocladus_malaysianus.AAC.1
MEFLETAKLPGSIRIRCEQRTESTSYRTVGFHGSRIHQTTSLQPHNEVRGPPPECSTARQQGSHRRTGGATALLLLGWGGQPELKLVYRPSIRLLPELYVGLELMAIASDVYSISMSDRSWPPNNHPSAVHIKNH